MAGNESFDRLPQSILPINYKLQLKPDLQLFTFDGKVEINISVVETTKEIILNCADIVINNITLSSKLKVLKSSNTTLIEKAEVAIFQFNDALPIGEYVLSIEFKGTLNDNLKGFYRSKYVDSKGVEKYAAVTQFQVADARRSFPCWDEPTFKATFDITLIVPDDRIAISNMPIISDRSDGAGCKMVTFDRTPAMSTYLIAYIVGEYDFVEGKTEDGIAVRVYTPLGKKEQGSFALEVTIKTLPYYTKYFNTAYPLKKLDLIALQDLSLAAMENWGLITYRESCLLVDSNNCSASNKQNVALIVGHEVAHQWFGNLVTMDWWTDLWLNEGFASFIEFLCVNHLFPDYDIWTQFITKTYIRALELDRLKNSHAIEVPVGHPSEINEIFDAISYCKGASIIRMLHNYIGDSDFRKGMAIYLSQHQYKSTFTDDLWTSLSESSGKPIADIMSTWTKQVGFPIVEVRSEQRGTERVLTLTQYKYRADPDSETSTSLWMIPITVSTQKQPDKIHTSAVIDKQQQEIVLSDVSPNSWVKLNYGTVGYYRTLYASDMLAQLIPAVKNSTLSPLDRLGLLNDCFAMVQAGHTTTVEFLKFLEAFTNENNYTVWQSISTCLSELMLTFSNVNLQKELTAYGKHLFSKIAKKVVWDPKPNEDHTETLLRSLVINEMVGFEDAKILAEAVERFEMHSSGRKLLSTDLQTACYRAALMKPKSDQERQAAFDHSINMYKTATLQEERSRVTRALVTVNNPELLRQLLTFSLSSDVKVQDASYLIGAVGFNLHGRDLTWEFFKDNWKTFLDRYQGNFLMSRLVKSVSQNLYPESKIIEVEEFFESHPTQGVGRTIQQSAEMIRLNASWAQRDHQSLESYLREYMQHNSLGF